MKRIEKAKYVMDKLEELYPEVPIPLDHPDAYTLTIAVLLLSAQCTDVRVNQITPLRCLVGQIIPADMVKLSVEEIKEIIQTLWIVASEVKSDLESVA